MIASLVLCIVSSAFTLCLIVPNIIGIDYEAKYWGWWNDPKYISRQHKLFALYCLMIILGLVQAVTAIVASRFSCAAICCRKNLKYPGTVIFAPAPVTLNAQTTVQSDSEGKYFHIYLSI